jgi:hypothetical protein
MKHRKMSKVAGLLGLALASGGAAVMLPAVPAHAQYYAPSSSASVMLNGQPLATSIPPLVEHGRTLVPMRDIFEALGATVVWNGNDRSISAQKDSTKIWLQIGNSAARVDNRQVWLDQAPTVISGSTLVPLRFVSEALGAQVAWNGGQRVVNINMAGLDNDRYHRGRNDGRGSRDNNRGDNNRSDHNNGNNDHRGSSVKGMITVPANAVVPVTLDTELSSATARKGDEFWVTVKSSHVGDSEFPAGTRLKGVVTDVTRKTRDESGAIRVDFRGMELPNKQRQSIDGSLISLDKDDVEQTSSGRIVAKEQKDGANATTVLIGAGAGYVLGHVILNQNSVLSGVIGALGGYLYGQHAGKVKPQEAVVSAGTELGVRLNKSVSYEDDFGYENNRKPYLR